MHVLTPADATSLSRERRHRLGEAIWLALDELTRIDEADGAELAAPDAPSIDGNDDFAPAPFHVWHPVVVDDVGWEFEWTMPMLDVFLGGLDDEIWLETHDELPAAAVDEPWADHGPYPDDLRIPVPELVDEDDACVIRTWDYEIAIGSRSIGIDVAGDLDRLGPAN